MNVLFHQNLVVCAVGSGSRGNCTYVGDGTTGLLIDCGLSTRQVRARLAAVGLPDAPIDAVLITHEHTDHVAAAAVLSRRVAAETGHPPPFYLSAGTRRSLNPKLVPDRVEIVQAGRAFRTGRWRVEPFAVPHDTWDPLGFVVEIGPTRVGVFTDLGRSTRLVQTKLASCDAAVVEFNHDAQLLMDGSYPWALKQRIRSAHGHLSNEQAEALVASAAGEGRLQHVLLAHLSEENNRPELAHEAASRAVHRAGRRVTVQVARQNEAIEPVSLRAPLEFDRPRRARPAVAPRPRIRRGEDDAQVALFG